MAVTSTTVTKGEKAMAADGDVTETHFGMSQFFGCEDAGDIYLAAERLTGPVATPLLEHAGLTQGIKNPISVLDLACGTGVVSDHLQQILKEQNAMDKVQLTCADLSDSQLSYVRKRIQEYGWTNARAVITNATKSTLPSDSYDVAMIAMALFLIPEPRAALKECFRMVKPGGTFAASLWLVEGWVPDSRDAVASLPGSPPWPQTSDELVAAWALGPWHNRSFAESMLNAAGFVDIKTNIVTRHIPIDDAEDFCYIFRAFVRVVAATYWTQKQQDEWLPQVFPAFKKFLNEKYGEGYITWETPLPFTTRTGTPIRKLN